MPPSEFGNSTRFNPLRIGSRPVKSAARLGVQTGIAVILGELQPLGGHPVEVRRADRRMPVAAQVAVAQVVGQQDDQVRRADVRRSG